MPNQPSEKVKQIWKTVQAVPFGKVASYGQIADLAGLPGRARLVGKSLGLAPHSMQLPWYRILRSSGQLAFEVNFLGPLNLARAATALEIPYIHISSAASLPAFSATSDALRVAMFSAAASIFATAASAKLAQPSGNSPLMRRPNSFASSGCSFA